MLSPPSDKKKRRRKVQSIARFGRSHVWPHEQFLMWAGSAFDTNPSRYGEVSESSVAKTVGHAEKREQIGYLQRRVILFRVVWIALLALLVGVAITSPTEGLVLYLYVFGALVILIAALFVWALWRMDSNLLENIKVTARVLEVRDLTDVAGSYCLYLRNFETEWANEKGLRLRHQESGPSTREDSTSACIHRSIQDACKRRSVSYVEACNMRHPMRDSARHCKRGLWSLSLYDDPDWRSHVSRWLASADFVIVNVNADTESLRFEFQSAIDLDHTLFLIEESQWNEWVQREWGEQLRSCAYLIYREERKEYEGHHFILPYMKEICIAGGSSSALDPDSLAELERLGVTGIDVAKWLTVTLDEIHEGRSLVSDLSPSGPDEHH